MVETAILENNYWGWVGGSNKSCVRCCWKYKGKRVEGRDVVLHREMADKKLHALQSWEVAGEAGAPPKSNKSARVLYFLATERNFVTIVSTT